MAAAPARRAPAPRVPSRKPAPTPTRRPSRKNAPPGRIQTARKAHPRGAAVLDKLLYGRGWIAIVFALLAGIVFFNVDLLQMNRDIAAMADSGGELKRENSKLRTDIARLGSSERIQRVAAEAGLVLPAPGEVRYLYSDPSVDARRAAARIEDGAPPTPAVPSERVVEAPVVTDAAPVAPSGLEPAPVEQAPVAPEPVTTTDPAATPLGQ
ncbi:MAG: hypothetical protein ACR2F4_07060 [Thermoleophilaceae bacterium]